jgi:TetR/AcrR family transcriptional regulator, mexJK operon transcriptional repressor
MTAEANGATPVDVDRTTIRILDVAKEQFLGHGYGPASIDRISEGARVSKATLYKRFPSKRDLFRSVIRREAERFKAPFDPDAIADWPVEEALRHIADAILVTLNEGERWRLEQILVLEQDRFPDLSEICGTSILNGEQVAIAAYIEHAADRARLRIDDPDFAARQFAALLKGLYSSYVLSGRPELPDTEYDAVLRRVVRLFLHGLDAETRVPS